MDTTSASTSMDRGPTCGIDLGNSLGFRGASDLPVSLHPGQPRPVSLVSQNAFATPRVAALALSTHAVRITIRLSGRRRAAPPYPAARPPATIADHRAEHHDRSSAPLGPPLLAPGTQDGAPTWSPP